MTPSKYYSLRIFFSLFFVQILSSYTIAQRSNASTTQVIETNTTGQDTTYTTTIKITYTSSKNQILVKFLGHLNLSNPSFTLSEENGFIHNFPHNTDIIKDKYKFNIEEYILNSKNDFIFNVLVHKQGIFPVNIELIF